MILGTGGLHGPRMVNADMDKIDWVCCIYLINIRWCNIGLYDRNITRSQVRVMYMDIRSKAVGNLDTTKDKVNSICFISIYIPIDSHHINNTYTIKTNKNHHTKNEKPKIYMKMSINLYIHKNVWCIVNEWNICLKNVLNLCYFLGSLHSGMNHI